MPETTAGTGTLLRAALRRDRWLIVWWSLGISALYWSQAVGIDGLYASQAELDVAAASMGGNTAMIAMAGPARALDTVGGQVAWQSSAFGAIAAGLMSMAIVMRHTRTEEETGRDELVRAAAVGRLAPVLAALLAALVANLAVGSATAVSLVVYPLSAPDSIALGLGLTLVGLCFTGTALVAAQVSASARTCYGLAGLVIGASYALRAVGDGSAPVLTWLSPIGWYQGMHAFSGLRWWPALLLLGATGLSLQLAASLLQRRDIGAGLRAARPGPDRAGAVLSSPLGLVWRLQRPTVLGWTAGLGLTGLAYGTIGDDVEDLLGDSETTVELMTQGVADPVAGFYATALLMLALITSGFAISSALRPRAEEEAGHAELLLSTAVSRRRWLASYVAVTVGGVLLVLAAGGLGTGTGYALVTGEAGAVLDYVGPALAYAPAVLVLSACARLVHGVLPRLEVLAWLPLIGAVVVMLLGPVLRMPEWVQAFSPFHHLPAIPAEDVSIGVSLALLAIATLVSFMGQLAFWRRDIG
ncbi:ABC transporter permease [uncultured Nocardioides sp.]|uniref:ABC transporter permease n=1 Tax=uncultured Nocardioides sp. TaxID=198441 RepID=UPI0026305DB8|nr:hypothetical protein [uncultured Nocardioides sp.]